jgi:para-aminobenzoate synthetase component 1
MPTRHVCTFAVEDTALFRARTLHWARRHSHFHYFTDNGIQYPNGGFPEMLAAGVAQLCPAVIGNAFGNLESFYEQHRDWLIGYLSYDLKNEIEDLESRHADPLGFPPSCFYIPRHMVFFGPGQQVHIHSMDNPREVFAEITGTPTAATVQVPFISLQPRTSRENYLRNVEKIREHILDGDVYELNYCMEFFAENASIDPLAVYLTLNGKSPMPFSVFGKTEDHYLICASPERFLKKTSTRLLSQPIKGTAPRGRTAEEDESIKDRLFHDEKERAENMMIVDLVRNDLARSAQTGSVRVEEMFGVYTFARLHQMISTVSAMLRPEVNFTEAIRNAFPMGSMTGAPKIQAMQLIDRYEDTRRGLYSGAAGFIRPDGDFDFNVVIRSILYNQATCYLSFQAGSAITYDARGEQEYEECLLKAQAMLEVTGARC